MKPQWILTCLLCIFQYALVAQLQNSERDSLNQLYKSESWEAYFKKIYTIGTAALKTNNVEVTLSDLEEYLNRMLPQKEDKDRLALRKAYCHYAYAISTLPNKQSNAFEYYLRAHQLVGDPYCLDNFAYYVENMIYNYCTIYEDFDLQKAIQEPIINSLIYHKDREKQVRFYYNIGISYNERSLSDQAIGLLLKAIKIANREQQYKLIPLLKKEIANGYLLKNNNAKAKKSLDEAYSVLKFIEDSTKRQIFLGEYFTTLGDYFSQNSSIKESIKAYKEALLCLGDQKEDARYYAKLETKLAWQYFKLKDTVSCDSAIEKGLHFLLGEIYVRNNIPHQKDIYSENTFFELFEIKAENELYKYHQNKNIYHLKYALNYLTLSLETLDQLRKIISEDKSKLLSVKETKRLVDKAIVIAFELYKTDRKLISDEKIESLFDYSKSLLLSEKLHQKNRFLFLSESQQNKIVHLENSKSIFLSKYNSTQDIAYYIEAVKVTRAINAIYNSVESNYKYNTPESYIEYMVAEKDVYAIQRSGTEFHFSCLGKVSELDSIIGLVWTMIQDKTEDKLILRRISKFLYPWPKIESIEVTIIPDGNIHFIPFDILLDSSGKYWVESKQINYRFHKSLIESPSKNVINTSLILSPEYEKVIVDQDVAVRNSHYDLVYAWKEAKAIKEKYLKSASLIRDISKSELIQKLRKLSIFHFSGHAYSSDSSCGIMLQDQLEIKTEELSQYSLRLDMAVLSACETGLGKQEEGEGVRSIAKSLHESGVRSSIHSLWSVNDQKASEIMIEFYKHLFKGESKDQALRNSKREFLRTHSLESRHPFYWAAFVASGDMSPILFNKSLVNESGYIAIALISILFLIFKFILR